jgi:CRISP-associated protein Cas1
MVASDPPAKPSSSPSEQPRPKTLGRLVLPTAPPDLVPARMINEVLYCERLMYLEWSQGEFEDNAFTVEGRAVVHANVDKAPKRARRAPKRTQEEDDDVAEGPEPPPYDARSVWLSSERLGITGKIDLVEEGEGGAVVPVEYKRGSAPSLPEQAHLPERAQVCAQALLLREHGYTCTVGSIYFAKDRRRVPVVIDDALVHTTLEAVSRARELARAGVLPPPLRDSPKCQGCSLVGICLPDEVSLLRLEEGQLADAVVQPFSDVDGPMESDPWQLVHPSLNEGLRRLHAARDDRLPLYVQVQGAYVSLDGERLVAKSRDGTVEARLPNTSQVCIMGNVQISTPAVRELLSRGIPLLYFTYGGWYLGRTFAHDTKNIELRIAQHRGLSDEVVCVRLARALVASKILNSRTMLRRNGDAVSPTVLFELKQLARKASEASSLESLLGFEGTAARSYFGAFSAMLKPEFRADFDFEGRNRRPPKDPVNALLSLAYAFLAKDMALAISASGLDPLLGFYHQPRFGRPALALDLMEEFRPIVADSVVIAAVNTGVIGAADFIHAPGACSLTSDARKRFIQAYERRMDQLVTHPLFGYRLSYRRVFEVQARLIGRLLLGELTDFPAFRTR